MRLYALASIVAASCIGAACSTSYGAADTPDASTADASDDGTIDGAQDGSSADGEHGDAPAMAIVTVAQENAQTAFVAVDTQSIYWWSVDHAEVRKVDKADPTKVLTVATRPGQTVSALAVDASGVYWLEGGPDEFDGGTSNRIMRVAPGTSNALPFYTQSTGMKFLALDSTRALSTTAAAIVGATKAGAPVDAGLGIDQEAFASDGTNVYYTFGGGIARFTPSGTGEGVIGGLGIISQLTLESPSMYGLVPSDGGLTLFRASATGSQQPASAATPITDFPNGSLFLAVDNLGVVVANAVDGTIIHVARTTGARTPVVTGVMSPNAVAADARGVYWTTDTGQVGWATR